MKPLEEELRSRLTQREFELATVKAEFQQFQDTSKQLEIELEQELEHLTHSNHTLQRQALALQHELASSKQVYLAKIITLQSELEAKSQLVDNLSEKLTASTKHVAVLETEVEEIWTRLRERNYELEEVTGFYHQTLEDLALTCSELDIVKGNSFENIQRLKTTVKELSQELTLARKKSFQRKLSVRVSLENKFRDAAADKSSLRKLDLLINLIQNKLGRQQAPSK